VVDVPPGERGSLEFILEESFEGWYLSHSKKTLREIDLVRAAMLEERPVGLVMLKMVEDAGYVYYIAVPKLFRGRGIATKLLESSLAYFSSLGSKEAYASVEEDNDPSKGLFESMGFVRTNFGEVSKRYGFVRAALMYRKMLVVPGEILLWKSLA
jgi:ribosomal protein S18 acetylase RimI-like enzyme